MTLTVNGLTSIYNATANPNYETPTNPKFIKASYNSDTDRIFAIIYDDGNITVADSGVFTEAIGGQGLLTEYSNLDNTTGHNIRCHATLGYNAGGVSFSGVSTDSNGVPDVNDYFVLIHSDDSNMHHLAKITSIEGADDAGDSFNFAPKLGNRIAKGTKFMLFKGPLITKSTNIIALTAGIKNSGFVVSSNSEYVCSRPIWYFYDDKLDKTGELNHNTKYQMRLEQATSGSSITLPTSGDIVTFLTVGDMNNRIIDSSKYSYMVKLRDELKIKDDPDTATSNESSVLAGTFTDYDDYNDCFINARRDSDDNYGALVLNGPTRYTHYKDSPMKNNLLSNVISSFVQESIEGKAGYAETKAIDNNRILGTKLKTNQEYRVKQSIGRGDLNEWIQVGEINSYITTLGSTYKYTTQKSVYGQDINVYFNEDEEIRIGDRICIYGSASSGFSFFKNYSRLLTESEFTNTFNMTTLANGTKIYRRAYSKKSNNILTTVNFEDNNTDKLKVVLISNAYQNIEVSVVASPVGVNDSYKLLYLDFEDNYYDADSGIEYADGDFIILYEVFSGKIEKITRGIENGSSMLTIGGRNTFDKLVNPIINKDALHSTDIIYSTNSPYSPLTALVKDGGGTTTITVGFDKAVTFGDAITLADKTQLWTTKGFIGVLNGAVASATSGTLVDNSRNKVAGETLYGANHNQILLNKSLSSNNAITSSTDLSAAADKGFSFKDGVSITDSSGAEVTELAGTSENVDARAIGYSIARTDSLSSKDSVFMLKDNIFGADESTINTLIDFIVLSASEDNGISIVKLAPYVPLSLGRSNDNFADTTECTFTTIGTTTSGGFSGEIFGNFSVYTAPYLTPVYIDRKYVGRFLSFERRPVDGMIDILNVTFNSESMWETGKTIEILNTKSTHDLHLINGAHLHGNKIIGLLSPHLDYLLNFETFDSSTFDSYTDKFGESIFRIFNLERGKIGHAVPNYDSTYGINNKYSNKTSNFNYYATSYKGRDKVAYNTLGSSTSPNILPIEKRGIRPITFSHGFGKILPNSTTSIKMQYLVPDSSAISNIANAWQIESKLNYFQVNSQRLFLFVNCDTHPYSANRKDSIMNTATRSIEKYGLLTMNNATILDSGVNKGDTVGETKKITYLDSQYAHSSIIESNKTLSSLKNFGLMRLTELVTDLFYNPINPEELNKDFLQNSMGDYWSANIEDVTQSSGATCQISSFGSFSGSALTVREVTMTLDATPTNLAANDWLIDMATGIIWGKVKTTPTSAAVAIYQYRKVGTDNNSAPSGSLYKIDEEHIPANGSRYTYGKEVDSSLYKLKSTGRKHHPNKMLLFGSANAGILGNHTLFPDNAWYTHYGETLLKIHTGSNDIGAVGPLVFGNDDSSPFLVEEVVQNCTPDGTTSLTVQDSSVINIGAYINKGAIANTNPTVSAGTYVTAIPDSTTVTLSSAASGSAGSVRFVTKTNKKNVHLHSLFRQYDSAKLGSLTATGTHADLSAHSLVVLGNFDVEDADGRRATAGESTYSLTSLNLECIDSDVDMVFPMYNGIKWGFYGTSSGQHDYSSIDGGFSGFKFIVYSADIGWRPIADDTDKSAAGNKTYKQHKVSHKGKYNYLRHLDLTGCYLVPLHGKDIDNNTISGSFPTQRTDIYGGNLSEVIYVVSHVYDTTTSITDDEDFSFITLDREIAANTQYKIMQPSPVCMWPNSPKEIQINHISAKYTKMPESDRMYGSINDFGYKEGSRRDREFGGASYNLPNNNEGISSMYVIVDLDNRGGNGNTVIRNTSANDNILASSTTNAFKGELCLSDGETNLVTGASISKRLGPDVHTITLEERTKLLGVVSCSEIFELKVNGSVSRDTKRAMIGTSIDISKESEALVEELFTENNISFSLVPSSYPIYTSPDFQGTSLYILAKYLLSLKNKTMFDNAGVITVVEENSSTLMSKFEFDDSNIIEYELVDSGFDFYNEIILYGSSHKSVKKNVRSINEVGRKTLEIFDKKLTTQSEVDKRARELLKIHNTETTNLEIKTHIRYAQTISSGDIVSVIINQENIERNLYMVLEMKYEISGQTTLLLGKYSKSIEDRFAEILLANKQTDSYIRRKDYVENEKAFDFFEDIKIKEINLVIRKRTATGQTVGFTSTLNTGTTTLGFGSGVTHTVLSEEDL